MESEERKGVATLGGKAAPSLHLPDLEVGAPALPETARGEYTKNPGFAQPARSTPAGAFPLSLAGRGLG